VICPPRQIFFVIPHAKAKRLSQCVARARNDGKIAHAAAPERHRAAMRFRSRANRCVASYLRAAQAYILISMPTGTSTIFGVFQAICFLQDCGASAPYDVKITSTVRIAQSHATASNVDDP
jgi:hypothetical protein